MSVSSNDDNHYCANSVFSCEDEHCGANVALKARLHMADGRVHGQQLTSVLNCLINCLINFLIA